MPAILTHDFFGRDVLAAHTPFIDATDEEIHAFLLGNQGPDPLFYTVIDPCRKSGFALGEAMHNTRPTATIEAFHAAQADLCGHAHDIAYAFSLGFICHHLLDSRMHPFIYAQQYALCDAGVEGLSRADGNEVHATIESSLDEEVLFARRSETIASYRPTDHVLPADETVLSVVSPLFAQVAKRIYSVSLSDDTYRAAVHCFRRVQRFFYSPTGQKREIAGTLEALFRRHSLIRAMSHRPVACLNSPFDNHEHASWKNPTDGTLSQAGFWDIYTEAQEAAPSAFALFCENDLPFAAAHAITNGKNYLGTLVD